MRRGLLQCTMLLVVIATIGCETVRRNDVIGTWVLDAGSREMLPNELRNANGRFVFSRDGTFVCAHVPGIFYAPDQIPARLENGHGTWRLVREQGNQEVQLNFSQIDDWHHGLPYGTQLFATRNRLAFFLGDPDEGRVIEFRKR